MGCLKDLDDLILALLQGDDWAIGILHTKLINDGRTKQLKGVYKWFVTY